MSFLYDLFLYVYFDFWVRYSINQKKMEYEDDTISKLIWCCYEANSLLDSY